MKKSVDKKEIIECLEYEFMNYKEETLTQTRIIVKEDGYGKDLQSYFNSPEIITGTVQDGYDIQIILGTVDAN